MKIDSKLLRKEACPQCKANGYDWDGNGLGIYDDGHTYCFKCKTYSNEVKNLLNMYDECSLLVRYVFIMFKDEMQMWMK